MRLPTRIRSAITGRFVTSTEAAAFPDSTVAETTDNRALLNVFVQYLHATGALSVPPEDLKAAVDRFAKRTQ